MQDLDLYQNIVIGDKEFPAQLLKNHILTPGTFFDSHWHEHVELHYTLQGEGDIFCNQNKYHVSPGSLLIVNSNELHRGICTRPVLDSLVLIFEMEAFSGEISGRHLLFQSLIQQDEIIKTLFLTLFKEDKQRDMGYKISMKGKIYDLIVYLMRRYVSGNLTEQEGIRRKQNLARLNQILNYMEENYMNPVNVEEMAQMVNLSPGRFAHLFKEVIGMSPGAYLNQLRLKKAYNLLTLGTLTSTEAAYAVGFCDYNNFGRQFRRQFQLSPSQVQNASDTGRNL